MIGDDKFAVVVIVMAVIFTGLAIYMLLLDRKITKLEKRQSEITAEKKL